METSVWFWSMLERVLPNEIEQETGTVYLIADVRKTIYSVLSALCCLLNKYSHY